MASYPGSQPPSAPPPGPPPRPNPPVYTQPSYGQQRPPNNPPGSQDDFMSKLTNLGKGVGNVVMGITKAGVNVVNKALQPVNKDWLKTGTVVQLIAKTSGRSLQILQSPDNRLILDGLGGEGPPYFNAHFTIISPEPNVVLLHNNFNYVAIIGGITQIHQAGPSGVATPKCRFKVRDLILGSQFCVFESAEEHGKYLSVLQSGMIKSALVTRFEDPESQFAVRVIYSPPH